MDRQIRLKAAAVGFVAAGVASLASVAFIDLSPEVNMWNAPVIHAWSAAAGALWAWLLVFKIVQPRPSRGYGAGIALSLLTLATSVAVATLSGGGSLAADLAVLALALALGVLYLGWIIVPIALVATWLMRNVVVGILLSSEDPQLTV